MDEPVRLLDQTGSSLEQALLQEGRDYQAPPNLHAHTLVALGLAGTAGVATSGVLAWLMTKVWTTKGFLVLSAASLLAVVPMVYLAFRQDVRDVKDVKAPAAKPDVVTPALVVDSTRPKPIAAPLPTEVPPSSPTVAPADMPGRPTARAPATRDGSALRAELAALDAVRSTLANDNVTGALSFLEAYFRTYPRGRLHLEAEVLRIDALAKGGRTNAAKQYAQEFLRRHPNSLLGARVQPYATP